MHRFINNTPDGFETDHIDRDKLNNRRENLRTATTSQNHGNLKAFKNNKLGVKGVSLHKCGKYVAQIKIGKDNIYLGLFSTIEDAKKSYDEAAQLYFGEFSNTK